MNLNQQPIQKPNTTGGYSDSVLTELWRVKDARAAKFGNAAVLLRHLREKYGSKR